MMFKSFSVFGFIMGSLLVLVPQPTTGFTVKHLGSESAFGEGHIVGALNKKNRVPIPDGGDALPDPDGIKVKVENAGIPIPNGPIDVKSDVDLDEKDIENSATDNYLLKFGYLKPDAIDLITDEEREAAIKAFQHYAGLKVTGIANEKTREQMFLPRCGLSDPVFSNQVANFETATKWSKKHLTYKIIKYSEKLDPEETKKVIVYALQMWSNVSSLTFSEVDSEPYDLTFSFARRDHGDGSPFDGSGGVLGHAFYPENGRIHLDDDENFTIRSKKGINLLFVLVHEIGHALGLGHSDVDNAIMGPYYYGYTPDLKLNDDDVAGIQFLYGKAELPTAAPPTKSPDTIAPTTVPPTTKAPTTQAPSTKAPTTAAPTTKAPTTEVPTTKTPTTQAPTTKAPTTQAPTTQAPTTLAPTTKAPTTQAPTTKAPTTTEYPHNPTTEETEPTEPTTPERVFPCPFNFWATMTTSNRTYGFFRRFVYEILPNGRIVSKGFIRSYFPRGPRTVGAAAYDEMTGHTFLFRGRRVYRYTDHRLDRGFPKFLPNYIRNAVAVDSQLIAFSFRHVHYLDEDTMEDYVDGEVTIKEEYPGLPYRIRSSISYKDGEAYMLYKQKIVKLDIYTGEMEVSRCNERLTATTGSTR